MLVHSCHVRVTTTIGIDIAIVGDDSNKNDSQFIIHRFRGYSFGSCRMCNMSALPTVKHQTGWLALWDTRLDIIGRLWKNMTNLWWRWIPFRMLVLALTNNLWSTLDKKHIYFYKPTPLVDCMKHPTGWASLFYISNGTLRWNTCMIEKRPRII